jgi:hypothetical protein
VGSGDCLKQREARSSRWSTGVLSLRFTPSSGKLSADEKARGRSGNILGAMLAASAELSHKGFGEGGNVVRWSGGGGKQQQVVLACWFREEEGKEKERLAGPRGQEMKLGRAKKPNGMCGKNQRAELMRGIRARFKRFCFSFSFFRFEIFEYCLNWI